MNLRIWGMILVAAGFSRLQAEPAGYLRAQGKFIGNDTGLVQLRGLGLGGWMIQEGYMFGTGEFAGTQHEIRAKIESVVGATKTEAFYQAWRDNFLTRQDIDSLAAWGFNSLRLPMHWNLYMEPGLPVRWKDEGFARTDSLLAWCKAKQIWLILDLHAAPGGQGNDNNISDRDPTLPSLWESAENRSLAVALWGKLADRYKDEPWIGAYDLLNEPNWPFDGANKNGCDETKNAQLRQLMVDMTKAIRDVDSRHLVIMEGNCWGGNYAGIMPPWDNNMAISFHKYWNSTDVSSVNSYFALRDVNNIPIWLGESGENGNEWFRQTIRMLEKEKIGWSWWPYKKIESVVGPLSVSTTPGWQAFVDWGNGGTKPDAALLEKGLADLANNLRIARCKPHPDVLDAMFRQIRADTTKPWREIHVPGSFGSEEFDLGGDGFAYHDANSVNVGVKDQGASNNGWAFRNDGVDIQWSAEEGAWNLGWIDADEWTNYTVVADTAATYLLLARTAGPGGRLEIRVDGNPAATLSPTPSAGWGTWVDSRSGTFTLSAGRHTLRLATTQTGYNLSKLRVAVATAACLQNGDCNTSSILPNANNHTKKVEWSSTGLRSLAQSPVQVRLMDPRGRVLLRTVLIPGESISSSRLPESGLLLLELDGRPSALVRP